MIRTQTKARASNQEAFPNDPDIQLADDLTQRAQEFLDDAKKQGRGSPAWCDGVISAGIVAMRIRELRT